MTDCCGWVSFGMDSSRADGAMERLAEHPNIASAPADLPIELDDTTRVLVRGNALMQSTRDKVLIAYTGRPRCFNDDSPLDVKALTARYLKAGEGAFPSIGGSFLHVVVDARQRTAFLLTDRFATVPLYYSLTDHGLFFSTHLSALRTLFPGSGEIDQQALYHYVFFHCIPSPRTIYKNIQKLGPGTCLEYHHDTLAARSYWSPNFRDAPLTNQARDSAAQAVRDALRDATKDATTEDSRCGAFLSGGLDSSTVAGMLKKTSGTASTFTVGFDEADYDESGFARVSATHFDTDHHEIFLSPNHVGDTLHRIAAFLDEPFGNSSVFPTYFCAKSAHEYGIETLLAGDGGDELFAGNTRYVEQAVFERYARLPKPLRALLESGYALLPALRKLPVARKGYGYISKATMGLPDRLQAYNFLHQFDPGRVFNRDFLSLVDTEEPWNAWRSRYQEPADGSPLQRMLYLDWKFTLADNDLVKVSNMCALGGVKVVYPMLDDRVLKSSLQLDTDSLLPGGELRGFFKNAFRGFLPPAVLTKKKHGFGLPFGVWMRKDPTLQEISTDALQAIRHRDIFAPAFVDTAVRMHNTEAPGYYGELVWIMMMLELWLASH